MSAIVVPEPNRSRKEESAAAPSEVTNPLQLLAEAQRRGASLEEIRQWMDLRDRFEATEARKAFDAAISAAKARIKPIVKNREVDFTSQKGRTNYKYEDFAGIAEAIDPILAEHGLSYRHRSQQDGKRLTITCILSHRAGHFEETSLSADNDESGNKNSIQGIGSTATYLQRYTLKLALGLSAAKDDDARTVTGDCISEKQIADLEALITEVGADRVRFLKHIRVNDLSEILAVNYSAVVQMLEKKRRG